MKVEMDSARNVLLRHGLSPSGDVQCFHTTNVMRRMQKYMPFLTGASIKLMIAQTVVSTGQIVLEEPQARYLYYGKAMVDSVTGKGPANIPDVGYRFRKGAVLRATDRDLNFTKNKNPMAGPFWDRRMWSAEGDVIRRELQAYANRRAAT